MCIVSPDCGRCCLLAWAQIKCDSGMMSEHTKIIQGLDRVLACSFLSTHTNFFLLPLMLSLSSNFWILSDFFFFFCLSQLCYAIHFNLCKKMNMFVCKLIISIVLLQKVKNIGTKNKRKKWKKWKHLEYFLINCLFFIIEW